VEFITSFWLMLQGKRGLCMSGEPMEEKALPRQDWGGERTSVLVFAAAISHWIKFSKLQNKLRVASHTVWITSPATTG